MADDMKECPKILHVLRNQAQQWIDLSQDHIRKAAEEKAEKAGACLIGNRAVALVAACILVTSILELDD